MEKNQFFISNETQELLVPGDREATLTFAANHFIQTARQAIQNHKGFYVALSGGSTPKALFQLLSTPPLSEGIDWSKVHLFWSDERSVPPTHRDSNYAMAMHAGLENLPIPNHQIHRMVAETAIEENAQDYEKIIQKCVPKASFDLIMLGMGEDGHTASLFPGTQGLKEKQKLIIHNVVAQKNIARMTMTFPCINKARHIVVYVIGAGKAEVLSKLFIEKNPFPIAKIGSPHNKALFIADTAATAHLRNNSSHH